VPDQELGPFKEFIELTELLAADFDEAATNLKSKTQCERRALVRTFFAYVEAARFLLKKLALHLYDPKVNPCFSNAELALLREESYDLDRKGFPITRTKFLPFETDLRFAFRAAAKAFGVDDPVDVSGKNWEGFKVARSLRDRITHPNNVKDCDVNINSLFSIVYASHWLNKTITKLARDVNRKLSPKD